MCRTYGARIMLGNRCPSPAGLTFGGRTCGPQETQTASLKNISRTSPRNMQIPFDFAQDRLSG